MSFGEFSPRGTLNWYKLCNAKEESQTKCWYGDRLKKVIDSMRLDSQLAFCYRCEER